MINNKKVFAIIMAAGKGTRIGATDKPKVMFEVAGKPIIGWAIGPFVDLKNRGIIDRIITIVGFHGDQVIDYLGDKSEFAWQKDQLGTGHAVQQAEDFIGMEDGYTLIVNGDHPLYSAKTFEKMLNEAAEKDLTLGFATVISAHRFDDYGRVIRNENGQAYAVVELQDATDEQKKIEERSINLYVVDNKWLFNSLKHIKPFGPKNEYYITAIVEMAAEEGKNLDAIIIDDQDEALGINTLDDRDEAEKILSSRK
jgi:bifunctional UDP-N-acetylglucosamine pyrophosphorylase/glucosamine-1-phosphate N-acetyltransferase